MTYFVVTPNAERVLREEVTDPWLMQKLLERFGEIAAAPTQHTEPAASPPYRPDRLMANFRLDDAAGREWTFVAILKRLPDEEGITITALRVGPPADEF